eukprot:2900604-Rhodomonas_salina.1
MLTQSRVFGLQRSGRTCCGCGCRAARVETNRARHNNAHDANPARVLGCPRTETNEARHNETNEARHNNTRTTQTLRGCSAMLSLLSPVRALMVLMRRRGCCWSLFELAMSCCDELMSC